ncbi:MAG: type I DNA topoisomerase [Leptolyngbya sp. PLA3]|nr:MAG: type I DNA topoisomerase [Cyanobacteria bacterium CYA]MCE7967669.1 type I DNA topoisomerase [Leptolyngbya sp. PL-A3]
MAKKTASTSKKTSTRRAPRQMYKPGQASGKSLVIVESPSKAKTINKYLGSDYLVLASVGHVRDLPSKAKKGDKSPVPGVDLEHKFRPSYEVLTGKEQVIRDLKRAAKEARDVWFATDLDREGEAIAWHLAEVLDIEAREARRVVFAAITKAEIERAFAHPHPIDMDRVNAQQARRILDRIVGYQVSPLLWKKVARGLSAGRVQSVAVRLVVEREREIRSFIPDEYWQIQGKFALSEQAARSLRSEWTKLVNQKDDKGNGPTVKQQNAWLSEHEAIRAELVRVGDEEFEPRLTAGEWQEAGAKQYKNPIDLSVRVGEVAALVGLKNVKTTVEQDVEGRGPARFVRTVSGEVDPATPYRIMSIETKRTSTRPAGPFITSTLQQAASSRLGFGAQRTMRAAQALYEGVEIPGEGPVGLITYMRTDSTHIAGEALSAVRAHIDRTYGKDYLPEKPNFFGSSNKQAQEAHEAIRPTSLDYPPSRVKSALREDQFKLYELIWKRFVACQMTPAEWDSTTFLIEGGTDPNRPVTFKANGRRLVFDGFYKVAGVPGGGDDVVLPDLREKQELHPFALDPQQKFTSPPARYTEASLIKVLESEGIGRPSTYASIIQVIQDRRYVEQVNRAFFATDLGEVVTDKLIEAFPRLMDVGYTRQMEGELDKVEDEHLDWVEMLERFYERFSASLGRAHEELQHAKAETQPSKYDCPKCGKQLVYRFGRNGRFLSCSAYPECTYASPVDRLGRPRTAEFVNIRCPKTGRPMVKRTGRFGPFVATLLEEGEDQSNGVILNIDKKGHVTAPSPPPLETDIPCPKCSGDAELKPDEINYLYLRDGVRGPWLGCSAFPKCRGRGKWADLPEEKRTALEKQLAAHMKANPIPIITTMEGVPLTDAKGRPLKDAPTVDQLVLDEDPTASSATAKPQRRGDSAA